MEEAALSPWKLLTVTAGFLAFLIGLYTLIGRERKSPYQINSILGVFWLSATGAAIDLASLLVPDKWRTATLYGGAVLLLIAMILAVYRLYILRSRFTKYIDSAHPKYFTWVKWLKNVYRNLKDYSPYEHNAVPIPEDLQGAIKVILHSSVDSVKGPNDAIDFRSAAIFAEHQAAATDVLLDISIAFLKHKYPVQYMTSSRHPIEFVEALKDAVERSNCGGWQMHSRNVVVIDAYTRHFGFADSVYQIATRRLKKEFNVTCVTSAMSYAGLHTASSRAFNVIKARVSSNARVPALIIYEDSFALSDLESQDQYRIFVRHVLPSERLWDGMFTIFCETNLPKQERQLLQSYASVSLELGGQPANPNGALRP